MSKPSKNDGVPAVRLRYLTSATSLDECPQDEKPEIGLVGRSNSGKSSLLNGLGMERVAKISSQPGKTRLLNFFDAGPRYRFVDMPGYGFSNRPGEEHHGWKKMIEAYLNQRENLCGVLLLMDVRRDWTDDEQLMVDWLAPVGVPVAVVATKIDKLGKNELRNRLQSLRRQSGVENFFPVSSVKRVGMEEIEEFVFKSWVKPRL